MTKAGGPDGCRRPQIRVRVRVMSVGDLLGILANTKSKLRIYLRSFIMQLLFTMPDGRVESFVTDDTSGAWSCRQGPIIWDHLFHGETYDARLISISNPDP